MFSGVQEAGIEFHATVSGFENYLRIQALWGVGCLAVFRQELNFMRQCLCLRIICEFRHCGGV